MATPEQAMKAKKPTPKNALKLKDGRKVTFYLDAQSVEKARSIGYGNVSEGIRRALSQCKEK
jgi:hypothetical protein